MKLSKLVLASSAAALLLSLTIQAKNEVGKAYIFGFSSSFNDSTVYFTDIQEIDSAWFTGKIDYLVSRENYSYQLRDYLTKLGEDHRTCMVEYNKDPKKLEKIWNKLQSRYAHTSKKKNNQKEISKLPPFQIKYITKEQFAFEPVAPLEEVNEMAEKPAKKVKVKKEKAPRGPKGAKGPGGQEGPGRPERPGE